MTDTTAATGPRFIGDRGVGAIGIGNAVISCNGVPREAGIRLLHEAIDAGIRLIDTARVYTTADHEGYGEEMLAGGLATHPAGSEVFVVTKGGHYREGDEFLFDGRPETIRRHFELTQRFLGDRVDLYLLHSPDPEIPIGRTMEAFAALLEEGLVPRVGVDDVTLEQLKEAMSVVPVTAVEHQFGPFAQDHRALLDFCTENGIAFLANSPFHAQQRGADGVMRTDTPRTVADLGTVFPRAAAFAARTGIPLTRLALAWMLTVSPRLIPITGASRPESIRDTALAGEIRLSEEDLDELDFDRRDADGAGDGRR